ncbi:MAG: UDP-N-acetylmuramoyl-L-alanine--D-glutamate ligase [Solirubrobacterales bacterium]
MVGLARSGQAAALALRRLDPASPVSACDSADGPELALAAERLREAGVEVFLNTDGVAALSSQPEPPKTVVKSPGVPAEARVVVEARGRGLEIIGELELGWRMVPTEFLAVTGTNGKTTTAEMIGAINRAAGLPVAVAGNVGTPLSSLAGTVDPPTVVVCEASSFQLEDSASFAPEVAVFLNFSDDHLDRHHGREQYLAAKLRLFTNQERSDFAVLNADDPTIAASSIPGGARRIWFGSATNCELICTDDELRWRGEPVMRTDDLALRGPHNLENAMAAAAATLARGVDRDAVATALATFEAVEHRLEYVATVGGVEYFNDSKATNVSATAAALRSFETPVHAILGGSLKGGGFDRLAAAVGDRCAACYLIGEAADRLAKDLAPSGVDLRQCGDLAHAVEQASERAVEGEVVLLAPACSSFDQYDSYERRGEHFRELVAALGKSR